MISLTCPRHNKQVLYLNVDEDVQLGLRTACDDCGLKTPISLNTGIQRIEKILQEEKQQIEGAEDREIESLLKLKKKIIDLQLDIMEKLNETIKFLDKSISNLRNKFKNLIFTRPAHEEINLTFLQWLAFKISENEKEGNVFQVQLKNLIQKRIFIFQNTLDKMTEITDYLLEKPLLQYSLHSWAEQDICLDSAFHFNKIVTTNRNLINCYVFKEEQLQLRQEMPAHKDFIESICFNKEYFISGGNDKIIRVWKYEAAKIISQVYHLEGHLDQIKSIVINSQNDDIYSASFDRTIVVWKKSGENWSLSQRLQQHQKEVMSISLNESNCLLLSGSWDKSLIVWEYTGNWVCKQQIEKAHYDEIYSVCFLTDTLFASGSKEFKTWSFNSLSQRFEQFQIIKCNAQIIDKIKFNKNILVSENFKGIDIWRLNKKNQLDQIQQIEGLYQGISISIDSKYISMYNVLKKQLEIRKQE